MQNEVSDEVILDLLPLYLSQSASTATRRLVEQYLASKPELASQLVGQLQAAPGFHEQKVLAETRRALRNRSLNLAFATGSTLAPLTFWYDPTATGVHIWWMVRDLPSLACAFWVMAGGFWVGFAIWSGRTRATGL